MTSPIKLNSADLLILPSGAIPMDFTTGHSVPEVEKLYQSSLEKLLTQRVAELQKQLRRVTRERDAYRLYVPRELLSMGQLIRHTPSPNIVTKQSDTV